MKHPFLLSCLLLAFIGSSAVAFSEELPSTSTGGQVELPRSIYDELIESNRTPPPVPRPAPASHALGSARVSVAITAGSGGPMGEVQVELDFEVLEGEWTLVPVLPAGTAVESATVEGTQVKLLPTAEGLAWGTRREGSFTMSLRYRVDARASENGWSLALPVPPAASITVDARLPGTGLDVAMIPAAGIRTSDVGSGTRVQATIPTTHGVQLSWRSPASQGHALSRANYRGTLAGSAVSWRGELGVELWSDETLVLPLLPRTMTLNAVSVDGVEAPILVEGDLFATLVKGRGLHTVQVGFEVPVLRADGPPRVELQVPAVPVSRFELSLPGRKEVAVKPAAHVVSRERGAATIATVHVPLSRHVVFSWAEAVPEDVKTEVRANASLYHAAYAEEGVLYVRALVSYEVSRGETNLLRLTVPPEVQVNRVSDASGAVADWRLSGGAGERELTVFLNRQLTDDLIFEVAYDRSLPRGEGDPVGPTDEEKDRESVEIPTLRAPSAQRQRGMVALLQSQDLTLEPVQDDGATRVGENQLPAFVRQALEMTVAHTYKYVEEPPRLTVRPTAPERRQGRFDARVDSLISLGEVSLKGATTVELDVKSGRIMELELTLPKSVNLLGLTGPSVRQHTVEPEDDLQRVTVEFTQEMDGQFRLELTYERLLVEGAAVEGAVAEDAEPSAVVPTERVEDPGAPSAGRRISVPEVGVVSAEVEQGRLAVEALSAVEVQPATVERLTPLDLSELPQQLILRTTNPILFAYKYVRPPYRLDLEVTPHELVELQPAAIDEALYRTLYTRDGLAVTTARFTLRNSGEQFLRLQLPERSTVWSTFVDGRSVKPARATDEDGRTWHLVNIIHSTRSFPVEVIFETPVPTIRGLGAVSGVLPRPEILVTHSRWDVYVPEGVRYGTPRGGMDLLVAGEVVTAETMAEMAALGTDVGHQVIEPLRLQVPTAGIHYAFEKLYANRSAGAVGFTLPYASGLGRTLGQLLTLSGAVVLWLGLLLLRRRRWRLGGALVLLGVVVLGLLIGQYQQSASPAVWWSGLMVLGGLVVLGYRFWLDHRDPEED